nr:VWA domain-containing protein [Thalassolituus pacificus]
MIVCLDTSGSMHGTPENIAKALVLECLSVAKKEKRACFVYLFGSRGEVEELELTPTKDGFERMILFLSMSFGGGTDAEGPLRLALEKSEKEQWEKADIMIVSDGAFPVSQDLVKKIQGARDNRSLSVHGTLIGNADRSMSRICDPLHRFSRWIDLQPNSCSY